MLKLDDDNYFRNLLSNNVEGIHTASAHNGGLYVQTTNIHGTLYVKDELMCDCNISAPMTVWVVVIVFFQFQLNQRTNLTADRIQTQYT